MVNRLAGGIARVMPVNNRDVNNRILSGIERLFNCCPKKDFHGRIRRFAKTAFEQMDVRKTGIKYASENVMKAILEEINLAC